MIFLTLFTVTFGYDVEKMVDRYNTTDVTIRQDAMSHNSEEKYQPIDENLLQKLYSIDTVEEMHLFYQGKKIEDEKEMKGLPYASTLGRGYIKINPIFEREYNRFAEKSISEGKPSWWGNPYKIEDGRINLNMIGVPADQLKDEAVNLNILDGKLSEEEFDGGGSIIFNQGTSLSNQLLEDGPRSGDVLELYIWDPGRDVYVEKEFKIMAVVESINPFHTSIIGGAPISLSNGDFKEIYPNYKDLISYVKLDTSRELDKEEYEEIEETVQESFNSQIVIGSRYKTRIEQETQKDQMMILGLLVSTIFGIIGLSNVVNTLVTSIMARKMEFATMQSIGMTKKQMVARITKDGIVLCLSSFIVAIPISCFVIYILGNQLLLLTGFNGKTFIAGCVILFFVMMIVTLITSYMVTWSLNKKTLTERIADVG